MAHSVRHPPTPPISVMAQVKEDSLLEVTEHLCDTDSEHGDWLPTLDVVKSGDTLAVRAPGGYGRCKKECSTMAYACRRHLEGLSDGPRPFESAALAVGLRGSRVFNSGGGGGRWSPSQTGGAGSGKGLN